MTATARWAVLMGDPEHFSIRGGANPHTRGRWGRRKRADRALAIEQWHGLAASLEEHGAAVFVVPPDPTCPGLVYPANAGLLYPRGAGVPSERRRFYVSNLLPSREREEPIYASFLESLGFTTARLQSRFEGEADFFPLGERFVFTYGRLERQRFVPHWGIPPYRRLYGFRSEIAALAELAAVAMDVEILPIELIDEAFYHGDTVLCSFGPKREFLIAYLDGLAAGAGERLRGWLGDRLVALDRPDAERYAANSFSLTVDADSFLFMPAGVSERLVAQVRERGVEPTLVDVSEFLRKGGGSIKCMIGDLGPWAGHAGDERVRAFREARRYRNLFSDRARASFAGQEGARAQPF